jgi:PEP-CTERM motif
MSAVKCMVQMLVFATALVLATGSAWAHPGHLHGLPSLSAAGANRIVPPAMRNRITNPGNRGGATTNIQPVNPVPEPTAILVFGAGALVTAVALRRRRRED